MPTHSSIDELTLALRAISFRPCREDDRYDVPEDSDIATEVEMLTLLFGLVRALKPKVVIETGCNTGCATRAIAWALEANGAGTLYTCDVEESNVKATQELHLPRTFAHCITGARLISEFAADLYFIDSSEQGRVEELEVLRQQANKGALVLVHDVYFPGIGDALRKAVESFPRHFFLSGPRGLGMIRL